MTKHNTNPFADDADVNMSPEEGTEPEQEVAPENDSAETPPTETDLEQQAGEYLAGWQRAQADYQNLQRDTARRVSDITKYANEGLLTELLPIVDYFQYAFKGIPEEERSSNWLKGIEHIRTNFLKVLEENNVKPIKTVGEQFNSAMHESLEVVEDSDKEHGIIIEEVAPGFTLNGKVIRVAKVKIAQ